MARMTGGFRRPRADLAARGFRGGRVRGVRGRPGAPWQHRSRPRKPPRGPRQGESPENRKQSAPAQDGPYVAEMARAKCKTRLSRQPRALFFGHKRLCAHGRIRHVNPYKHMHCVGSAGLTVRPILPQQIRLVDSAASGASGNTSECQQYDRSRRSSYHEQVPVVAGAVRWSPVQVGVVRCDEL